MKTDDPKFTAYALDELEPAERAEIEALLANEPAIAAELDELRIFAAKLRTQLHAEEGAPLTSEQRAELLGEVPRVVAMPRAWWRRPWVQSAAAACVIVGASAALLSRMHVRTPLLAQHGEPSQGVSVNTAVALGDAADARATDALAQMSTDTLAEEKLELKAPAVAPSQTLALNSAQKQTELALRGLARNGPQLGDDSNLGREQDSLSAAQPGAISTFPAARASGVGSAPSLPAQLPTTAEPLSTAGKVKADIAKAGAEFGTRSLDSAAPADKLAKLSEKQTFRRAENSAGMDAAANTALGVDGSQSVNLSGPVAAAKPQSAAPSAATAALGAGRATAAKEPATGAPVAKAKRLMEEARQFAKTGRYDLAEKRTDEALADDQSNIPARKLREEITAEQKRYAGVTSSETRSRLMGKLDKNPEPASAADAGGVERGRDQRGATLPRESASPAPTPTVLSFGDDLIGGRLSAIAVDKEVQLQPARDGLDRRESEHLYRFWNEQDTPSNTEAYDSVTDNAFLPVKDQPLSTFSIDVDSASYANVRRFLNNNERPPKGAVRIEELVNYFRYDYPQPDGPDPFSCALEVATCPWQTEHRLVRIGLKGKEIKREARPVANLVFLVDVSGSMQPENKLPLVRQCLKMLVDQLNAEDRVAIAVYAGASGCVLEPTSDKTKIRAALSRLEAGGSTNGAAGLQLAYDLAQRSFKKGGTNRVILCTDGDFNVGVTSQSELVAMIQAKAKSGIFLSVLGFGMGNLKDSTLEKLADKGNGNYAYIDTLNEGRRVFVEQMSGTLITIAKDVKVQVEFNPAQVAAYRLIGYENRLLAKEDFNDDTKDAGEIGAGHTVTALYEVVPVGKAVPQQPPVLDDLKYQPRLHFAPEAAPAQPPASPAPGTPRQGDFKGEYYLLEKDQPRAAGVAGGPVSAGVIPREVPSRELLTVKLRYKQPEGDVSKKLEFPLTDSEATWEKSSLDFRWAASVASFGLLLRDSPHKGSANWSLVEELATEGKGDDRDGYRAEFVGLVEKAKALSR